MLLGEDVDGLLLRIGGNNVGVVGMGPGGSNVTFKQRADSHFGNRLTFRSRRVAMDFVEADIVFTIAGVWQSGHSDKDCDVMSLMSRVVEVNVNARSLRAWETMGDDWRGREREGEGEIGK